MLWFWTTAAVLAGILLGRLAYLARPILIPTALVVPVVDGLEIKMLHFAPLKLPGRIKVRMVPAWDLVVRHDWGMTSVWGLPQQSAAQGLVKFVVILELPERTLTVDVSGSQDTQETLLAAINKPAQALAVLD